MLYQFKSKMVSELNLKQEIYINNKKEKYSFRNKSRIEPYKVAQAIDSAESSSIKRAVDFASISHMIG